MRSFGYRFLVYQRIAHLTLDYEITFPPQILTIITIFFQAYTTQFSNSKSIVLLKKLCNRRTLPLHSFYYLSSGNNTSFKASSEEFSVNFTLDRYAARVSKCPDTGAVKNTNNIPSIRRTLIKFSLNPKVYKGTS